MRFSLNKKILLGGILLVGAVVLLFPQFGLAQAQPPAIASFMGNGIADSAKGFSAAALLFINPILYVTQNVLVLIVGISGYLLDVAFKVNIDGSVANMPVVQEGWRISRDIANAFFILIMLWIAFTIIFSIEQYGGKRLLVRTIIVALLINFSLVFVSATFGFTNMLAKTFADNMIPPNGDIAGIMVDALKLHATPIIAQESDSTAAADNIRSADQQSENLMREVKALTTKDKVFAALGIPTANAAIPGGGVVAGCIAAIWFFGVGCVGGAIAGGAMEILGRWVVDGLFSWLANMTTRLILSNIMLALGSAAFLIASITLLIRAAAMIFLSVIAPLAFLAQLIPNKDINKYWSEWLSALMRWAFFAPMFYFMFYLIMILLSDFQKLRAGRAVVGPIDIEAFFVALMVIFMLIAAIKLSRKTGGAIAETAISLGKQAGLAAATGGAGMLASRALPVLGARATQWDQALTKKMTETENPYLRTAYKTLALPAAGFRQLGAIGRGQVDKAGEKYKNWNVAEVRRGFETGQFRTPAERAWAVQKMAGQQDISGIKNTGALESAVKTIHGVGGDFLPVVRANPSLAKPEYFKPDELKTAADISKEKLGRTLDLNNKEDKQFAAVLHVFTKIRPEHYAKLDTGVFADKEKVKLSNGEEATKGNLAKEAFWATAQDVKLTRIRSEFPSTAGDLQQHLEENKERLVERMDPRLFAFFDTPSAAANGWVRPVSADGRDLTPVKSLEENKNRTEGRLKILQDKFDAMLAMIKEMGETEARNRGEIPPTFDTTKAIKDTKRLRDNQNRIEEIKAELRIIGKRISDKTSGPTVGT